MLGRELSLAVGKEKTPEEALAELGTARKAWLKAAKAAHKRIPPPRYRPAIYQLPMAG